jgi:CRP-like cAMP-binding protein
MRRSALPFTNSNAVLAHIVSHGSVAHFKKRQIIFSQGTCGHTMFCLNQGTVKLAVTSQEGKEAILGDLFGEDAVIADGRPRPYSAVCLTNVQVTRIDCARFVHSLRASGEVSHNFIVHLLLRYRQLQEHLANCLVNTSDKRLVHALSVIASTERRQQAPKVTQQTLAEMIGTTRQRVNVLMKNLRRVGLYRNLDI